MASFPFEIPADRMSVIDRYKDRGRLIIRIEKMHETIDFFGTVRERDLITVNVGYEDSKHIETIVTLPFTDAGYMTAHAAASARAKVDGGRYDIIDSINIFELDYWEGLKE